MVYKLTIEWPNPVKSLVLYNVILLIAAAAQYLSAVVNTGFQIHLGLQ